MLLSICIPTYRREPFLEIALTHWKPEIESCPNKVELIVGDNDASDRARELAKAAGARYVRHGENLYFNGNVLSLARDHARGRYVWICGDDDFVHRGALAKVVDVIERNADLGYFYINTRLIRSEDCTLEELRRAENSPRGFLENIDTKDRRLAQAQELASFVPGCFTGIYSSVWRREDAIQAFTGHPFAAFITLESTLPHACHIARNLLSRPCYYFGSPLMTVSLAVAYAAYGAVFRLHWLPRFYDLLETQGVPAHFLHPWRRRLIPSSFRQAWELRRQQRRGDRRAIGFSLRRFLLDNWRYPEFHSLILTSLGIRKLLRRLAKANQS